MPNEYFVYILTNKSGTLYIGVTNDIARRLAEHREHQVPGFTSRYRLNRLLHLEIFDRVEVAIAREKQLKNWSRAKKIALIMKQNPRMEDLSELLIPG